MAVQRQATGRTESDHIPPSVTSAIQAGGGRPLDKGTRERMEGAFGGADFRQVRVHTGSGSVQAARDIQAKAFTTGQDIHFGEGQFQPGTHAGDKLLSHELTHTIQQGNGAAGVQPAGTISQLGDPLEREADATAQQVMSAQTSSVGPSPTVEHEKNFQNRRLRVQGHANSSPDGAIQRDAEDEAAEARERERRHAAPPVTMQGPAEPQRPREEWFYYRGVIVTSDLDFMRSELWQAIGRLGADGVAEWHANLVASAGRPGGGIPLPFSAHTRGYGGLRPRTALDALQDMRQEELRARVAPRAIPVATEALRQVTDRAQVFMHTFEARARLTVATALTMSRDRTLAEQQRYGIREVQAPEATTVYGDPYGAGIAESPGVYEMDATAGTRGIAMAARSLARSLREIMRLRGELARISASNVIASGPIESPVDINRTLDDQHFQQVAGQLREAKRSYQVLRNQQTTDYPILAAFAPDPEDFTVFAVMRLEHIGGGASRQTARTLYSEIAETLGNINQTYANLRSGSLSVWRLSNIIQITSGQIPLDPAEQRLVRDKVEREAAFERGLSTALSVLALGLGLIAAIPTGGASLAVTAVTTAAAAGAAATSTVIAVRNVREYQIQAAARGTDFEKARAISAEDPSLFWLALDLISAGLDIVGAATAFRTLRTAVTRAVRLRRAANPGAADAVREAAELAEAQRPGRGLGRKVTDEITSQARRADTADVAVWEQSLNQQTRSFLVDNPGARATYAELDPVVRQILTHCSELCIIANATRRDAARVRALIDRLQLGDDELGYLREYFHIRRNNIARALEELEGARDLAALRGRLLRALERAENVPPALPAGVTAQDMRNTQGVATGGQRLPRISDPAEWLAGTQGRVGVIPRQIANQLRGRPFASFADLRAEIWRLIAADDRLSRAFWTPRYPINRGRMAEGLAPFANVVEQTGPVRRQQVFNIHHIDPIEGGGAVYDLDNLIIVSPLYHELVHYVP